MDVVQYYVEHSLGFDGFEDTTIFTTARVDLNNDGWMCSFLHLKKAILYCITSKVISHQPSYTFYPKLRLTSHYLSVLEISTRMDCWKSLSAIMLRKNIDARPTDPETYYYVQVFLVTKLNSYRIRLEQNS